MKKRTFLVGFLMLATAARGLAAQGVAIQRVITNTRSELGQLASSRKAEAITALMQTFDTQYETWSASCGNGENFNPEDVSDACRAMADQMRETGISLYGKLAEYLPDVAARYEQGAKSAKKIVEAQAMEHTPASLYQATLDGISEAPNLKELSTGNGDNPFDLEMDDFPDPTEKMFTVLERLVPDFGKEIPEAVRAGNAMATMSKKAKRARYLAERFEKARFVLESQREYGEIVFNVTNAVTAMPQVLGIQYTGTRLSAKPNQKVMEYYRQQGPEQGPAKKERKIGGLDPKS